MWKWLKNLFSSKKPNLFEEKLNEPMGYGEARIIPLNPGADSFSMCDCGAEWNRYPATIFPSTLMHFIKCTRCTPIESIPTMKFSNIKVVGNTIKLR